MKNKKIIVKGYKIGNQKAQIWVLDKKADKMVKINHISNNLNFFSKENAN